MAVEPENRLVARTLEQRWEEALSKERARRLANEQREQLLSLASDVPALWKSDKTTMKDRQEIVRCLVEEVVLRPQADSECVDVTIHWAGGFQSEHEIVRPVGRYEQLHDFDRIITKVVELRRRGFHSGEIAETLNADGYATAQMRPFNEGNVWALLGRDVVRSQINDRRPGPNEWNVDDLASKLRGMSTKKLKGWVRGGWATAVQRPRRGPWILWADDDELARLQELAACSSIGVRRHPVHLTTPKQPPCGS
jgi:hypothetical protein